jgi:hypothetical protein
MKSDEQKEILKELVIDCKYVYNQKVKITAGLYRGLFAIIKKASLNKEAVLYECKVRIDDTERTQYYYEYQLTDKYLKIPFIQ